MNTVRIVVTVALFGANIGITRPLGAEEQRTLHYYVYGAPYVTGQQFFTPLELRPMTLQVQSTAAATSQDASAQGLETLLVDLLGRVLGGIIDREFPPGPNPPSEDRTQRRLKAIEDYLKSRDANFQPASAPTGPSGGGDRLIDLPAAASASDLSSQIDVLSTKVGALTDAINRLADAQSKPAEPAPGNSNPPTIN